MKEFILHWSTDTGLSGRPVAAGRGGGVAGMEPGGMAWCGWRRGQEGRHREWHGVKGRLRECWGSGVPGVAWQRWPGWLMSAVGNPGHRESPTAGGENKKKLWDNTRKNKSRTEHWENCNSYTQVSSFKAAVKVTWCGFNKVTTALFLGMNNALRGKK